MKMIDIYMNDAAIHAEEPYEEEEAEVVLSDVLARNLDMPEGCIWASRYEEAFKKVSLSSLGAKALSNHGVTNPERHRAPAAIPGVLVKRSTLRPSKKPKSTYSQRGVTLGKMSRK